MISIALKSRDGFMSKSCCSQSSFTLKNFFTGLAMNGYKRVLQKEYYFLRREPGVYPKNFRKAVIKLVILG